MSLLIDRVKHIWNRDSLRHEFMHEDGWKSKKWIHADDQACDFSVWSEALPLRAADIPVSDLWGILPRPKSRAALSERARSGFESGLADDNRMLLIPRPLFPHQRLEVDEPAVYLLAVSNFFQTVEDWSSTQGQGRSSWYQRLVFKFCRMITGHYLWFALILKVWFWISRFEVMVHKIQCKNNLYSIC